MKLFILLLAFFSVLSYLSGSRSTKLKSNINHLIPIKRTIADSSNSDTTSSDDSDDWSRVKKPKFNLTKTNEQYKNNIDSRKRNLKLCAGWDMEASIGSINEDAIQNYPVEIEEPENQITPQKSVVSRIMIQYRKDLGFDPVESFSDSKPEYEEIQKFLSCYESRPKNLDHEREERRQARRERRQMRRKALKDSETIRKAGINDQIRAEMKLDRKAMKRGSKMRKLSEAYSFLKFLGIIPQLGVDFDRMTCDEIKARTGDKFHYLQDIREAYKTELKYYTFLNWDYLDLTHFEFHKFPIMNQITRNITYTGNKKVISPPVFMPRGLNVLSAYEENIRFHNPRTIEGRRMLLFQRLYRRYHAAMCGSAHPSFITWENCKVENWPSHIDRSDLSNWTDDDLVLLEGLIENELLDFSKTEKRLRGQPASLGMTANFHERCVVKVRSDLIEGDECAISDDEKICIGSQRKEVQEISKTSATSSADSVPNVKRDPAVKRKTKTSEYFSSNSANEAINIDPSLEINNIKAISNIPADEQERAEVFAQALKIFRETSGQMEAEEIDWSLLKFSSFKNHLIPFSTGFETQGDVQILAKFIGLGKIIFLNLEITKGRAMRIFERLYQKCAIDIGYNLDEFIINWRAVEVKGWPEDIRYSYSRWKCDDIPVLEARLKAGNIVFSLNETYSKFRDDSKELLKSSEEDFELNNVPLSVRSCLLLKDYNSKTIGPLCTSFDDKTPSFAAAVLSPTNRKRPSELIRSSRSDSSDSAEDEQPAPIIFDKKAKKIKATKSEADIVKFGEFSGFSIKEIDEFAVSVHESIAQFSAVRDSNVHCSRKNLIISEIIRALQLILQHTNCRKISEIPAVSVGELNGFISSCCDTLLAVDKDGYLEEGLLRQLVLKSVNLRARLSGAQGNLLKTTIKKGIVLDMEMFGFLVSSDPTDWNIEFLAGFLGDDAMPIFKASNSNKNIKNRKHN